MLEKILSDKDLKIGDVFTPLEWAEFAIDKFDLFSKWIKGSSIFDPTMGEGNLLEALITYGLSKGFCLQDLPTQNLFGNELNTTYYNRAKKKFKEKYNLDLSPNFTNEDLLNLKPQKFDIVFGNPPWQNFVDLPDDYKSKIKSYFFKYDLVESKHKLLLGGSRIDIAALIIQISIKEFLSENGEAIFFMPLSLLLNDGASNSFRTYKIKDVNFRLQSVFDFNDIDVFTGVATRYGLCHLIRDQVTQFPINYYHNEDGYWKKYLAKPLFRENDPLSISEDSKSRLNLQPLNINKESRARQGINTCGANHVFFFNNLKFIDEEIVSLSNPNKSEVLLPKRFIYPLITTKDFKNQSTSPSKWVLLPYNKNGKLLKWHEIEKYPSLKAYLESERDFLQKRKGVLLNTMLKDGYWWAMLGVGKYTFFSYKVVWESYGKKTFNPKIFTGDWQANQSLQAYIPVKSLTEAQRIHEFLSDQRIEKYLLSMKMQGTMNWAQPGKINKLFSYK